MFRDDYRTVRRDRNTRVGGVFICVRDCIACAELRVNEGFEMIAVEVKGRDNKFTWKNCRHLESCERGHASYIMIGGPNGLFGKFHKA
jgi:hypothetical protein